MVINNHPNLAQAAKAPATAASAGPEGMIQPHKTTMSNSLRMLIALGALAVVTAAQAQTPPAPANDNWMTKVKNPAPWLTWGGDLRFRNEYFDNALTLNPNARLHEQDYFRFRGRVFATAKASDQLSLNARLTAEPRYWVKDAGYGAIRNNHGADWQEGIIDNLNVKWKEVLGQPLNLTLGRQDIMLGDGWLVMDGTPLDGSRTFFFDAARFTYDWKDKDTTIEAFYLDNSAMNDAWLPPLNHISKPLSDQDERGAILWIANKSVKALNVDLYFMYKHDHDLATAQGVNSDLYTPGMRLSGLLGDHWKYRMEGALQFGQRQEPRLSTAYNGVEAFGFNSRLSYLFKDKWNNQLHLDYEYLSGDDPATARNEMFDVLWARWPRFSEMYIYSYAPEVRIAQVANLHRFGPSWTLSPTKKMDLSFAYNLMYADEPASPLVAANAAFAKTGSFRGHYLQGILKYKFCANASGHLWAEMVAPGSFYTFQQPHTWLRAEMLFTF